MRSVYLKSFVRQVSNRRAMESALTPVTLPTFPKRQEKMLDDAGFPDAVIAASNDLDEYLIHDLKMQGAAITSWGSERI